MMEKTGATSCNRTGTRKDPIINPGVGIHPKKEELWLPGLKSIPLQQRGDCKSHPGSSSGRREKMERSPISVNQNIGNCTDEDSFSARIGAYDRVRWESIITWAAQGAMFYASFITTVHNGSAPTSRQGQAGGWT